MRHLAVTLPLLLCACGTTEDGIGKTDPAVPRGARTGLLAGADQLAGAKLATSERGAWTYRSTAARGAEARAAAPAGAAGPSTGGPARADSADMEVSEMRAAEPAGPGHAADGGAIPVAGKPAAGRAPGSPALPVPATAADARPAPLRAGASDDNVEFDAFLAYLATARQTQRGTFVDLDVAGRCALRVLDRDGKPVPGTELHVVDEATDKVVWRGTTYGDGRVPFYPAVAKQDGGIGGPYLVEAKLGDRVVRHMWQGTADTEVRLPTARTNGEPVALDVVFVIDTTGSMQDEIDAIKATLLDVTQRLRGLDREFDLRYGAVLYRDVGDDYVTASHPFTKDLVAFDAALRDVQAGGGGDGPESLNQALAVAVDGMAWRPTAAKVAFLIADAPPHLDYDHDIAYDRSLRAAVARGIRVHAVAASGLDPAGSVVFRQIAQWTRGEFVFVEYGGDVQKSAAAHGVARPSAGNNLDDILFTRIRDEIARWGL